MTGRGYFPTGIYYDRNAAIYVVDLENASRFMFGFAWVALDAATGRQLALQFPGEGSGGDVFLQLQFPLHSGRIGGLAGRIVISVMGVAIAVLSVTGIIIWLKKSRARLKGL
jgi:uncharacterized iron-regulated membrane protein